MTRRLMFCGLLLAAFCAPPGADQATAGPVPYDSTLTIPANVTCQTNSVPLYAGAFEIDSLVFYSEGSVTSAVAVASSDLGVFTALGTFALPAGGGSILYPRRAEVAHTTTNAYPHVVRDLRVITYKQTNASDVVINFRVKFADN